MKANQYVVFNTLIVHVKTIIVLVIFFASSRYLLQALGVEGFGLYSLVIGITATLEFIISGLTATTSRFTILAIGKKDLFHSRVVFNTINKVNKKILLWCLLILEIFGLTMILFILKIPKEFFLTSVVIFHIMVLDTYYKIKVIPYNSLLIAKENFLFINIVAISLALLRLGAILLLFIIPFDKLIFYVFIMFILSLTSRKIIINFTARRYNEAYIDEVTYQNSLLFSEVMSFIKYSWIGQISNIIRNQGTNFFLNIFSGGVIYNAAFAISKQVSSISDMAFSPISQTILPQTLKSYSNNNIARFTSLTLFNSKLAILLSWAMIIPLLLESNFILNIWLVEIPQYAKQFITLILIDEMIRQLTNGLAISSVANNKVKKVFSLRTVLDLIGFITTFVLLKLGFQFWVIFYVLISFSIVKMFVNLIFAHKYLSINMINYLFKIILPPILICIMTLGLGVMIQNKFMQHGTIVSLCTIAFSFIFYFVLFTLVLFTKEEKNKILKIWDGIKLKIFSFGKN